MSACIKDLFIVANGEVCTIDDLWTHWAVSQEKTGAEGCVAGICKEGIPLKDIEIANLSFD